MLARLREEIMAKIGPRNRPTYEAIRDMKYLRAVINGKFFHLVEWRDLIHRCSRNIEIIPRRVRTCIHQMGNLLIFAAGHSIFGKNGMGFFRQVLTAVSESVKATTLSSSDPSEKPYYVPAKTQYVTGQHRVMEL